MAPADPGESQARAPRRRRKSRPARPSESTIAVLDRLLMQPRAMSLGGEQSQIPTIDVIVLQLLQKEMAGSLRARNVLLKYAEFAHRRTERKLEMRFADSDYSRSIAAGEAGANG